MNIRNRIKEEIKSKGYSIRQLGRISGVSYSTINNFLDGKNIKFDNFSKLINGLDFNNMEQEKFKQAYEIDYFNETKGLDLRKFKIMELKLKEFEKIQEQGKLPNQVPIYGCVSAGCGYIPDAEPVDWISMNNRENLKGVIVSGQSMESTIPDKSVVFFKDNVEIKNGDIGVFLIEGEGYIKRFFKNKNIIILDSDNKDYPPIMVDEYSDFKICGKVVKVLSNV